MLQLAGVSFSPATHRYEENGRDHENWWLQKNTTSFASSVLNHKNSDEGNFTSGPDYNFRGSWSRAQCGPTGGGSEKENPREGIGMVVDRILQFSPHDCLSEQSTNARGKRREGDGSRLVARSSPNCTQGYISRQGTINNLPRGVLGDQLDGEKLHQIIRREVETFDRRNYSLCPEKHHVGDFTGPLFPEARRQNLAVFPPKNINPDRNSTEQGLSKQQQEEHPSSRTDLADSRVCDQGLGGITRQDTSRCRKRRAEENRGTTMKRRKTSEKKYHRHAKPPYSYVGLIALAIQSSPAKMLKLSEVISKIKDMFSFFKGEYQGWKDSVRHNLSLNSCFSQVLPDPARPNSKGNYWTVDVSKIPPEKLRRQNTAVSRSVATGYSYARDLTDIFDLETGQLRAEPPNCVEDKADSPAADCFTPPFDTIGEGYGIFCDSPGSTPNLESCSSVEAASLYSVSNENSAASQLLSPVASIHQLNGAAESLTAGAVALETRSYVRDAISSTSAVEDWVASELFNTSPRQPWNNAFKSLKDGDAFSLGRCSTESSDNFESLLFFNNSNCERGGLQVLVDANLRNTGTTVQNRMQRALRTNGKAIGLSDGTREKDLYNRGASDSSHRLSSKSSHSSDLDKFLNVDMAKSEAEREEMLNRVVDDQIAHTAILHYGGVKSTCSNAVLTSKTSTSPFSALLTSNAPPNQSPFNRKSEAKWSTVRVCGTKQKVSDIPADEKSFESVGPPNVTLPLKEAESHFIATAVQSLKQKSTVQSEQYSPANQCDFHNSGGDNISGALDFVTTQASQNISTYQDILDELVLFDDQDPTFSEPRNSVLNGASCNTTTTMGTDLCDLESSIGFYSPDSGSSNVSPLLHFNANRSKDFRHSKLLVPEPLVEPDLFCNSHSHEKPYENGISMVPQCDALTTAGPVFAGATSGYSPNFYDQPAYPHFTQASMPGCNEYTYG